jgi:DNA invertase Pin-like site-specific DNA recombinase
MLIGDARVSTSNQNLDLQTNALIKTGCEKIFTDTQTGRNGTDPKGMRPGLARAVDQLRAGDTLVVWRLDRLGRNVRGLLEFADNIKQIGVEFKSIRDNIDTTTAIGRLFFIIIAAMAQMEADLTAERAAAGRDAARSHGRLGGRLSKLNTDQLGIASATISTGKTYGELASTFGVARSTVYRSLQSMKTRKTEAQQGSKAKKPKRITEKVTF